MATTKAPALTDAQKAAVAAAHAYLDRRAAKAPGAPDTAELAEARALRTRLEESFPAALAATK